MIIYFERAYLDFFYFLRKVSVRGNVSWHGDKMKTDFIFFYWQAMRFSYFGAMIIYFFVATVFTFSLIFGGKCRRGEREPARCAENKVIRCKTIGLL